MTTLNGKTNLTLQNAPLLECEKKLGLIVHPRGVHRTYRLSRVIVSILENITKKLSKQAGVDIPMTKVVELAILNIKDKKLHELISIDDK